MNGSAWFKELVKLGLTMKGSEQCLDDAIRSGNVEIVKEMLEIGDHVHKSIIVTGLRYTLDGPLPTAIRKGHYELVVLVLPLTKESFKKACQSRMRNLLGNRLALLRT